MDQRQILQEIAGLLEIILEETETISRHSGKIPQIELDLVMGNIRQLYQAYVDLNKNNTREGGRSVIQPANSELSPSEHQAPATRQMPGPAPVPAAPVIQTPAQQTSPTVVDPLPPPVKESPVVVETPPAPAPAPMPVENGISETPHVPPVTESAPPQPRYTIPKRPADLGIPESRTDQAQSSRTKESKEAVSTLADKLKTNQPSLHDKLEAVQNGSTLADKLQQNRIQDIKSALGINERFLFINTLFKGDQPAFEEAVANLNGFAAYPEAAIFLKHLASRYEWDEESEACQKLQLIIKRRYL
ncbi:MAG: hypothetical protein KA053_04430 [Lentimicrobiaceae bacterium]|nr:hypothetical protein [Lentimicrobiaceae bacterium]